MKRETLLVTGFGPFPGAPENPTAELVEALSGDAPESFGVGTLRTAVLPTEFVRSWSRLRSLYRRFDPDIVVHFGLSARATEIRLETSARNRVGPERVDASGATPRLRRVSPRGPERLLATLPTSDLRAALLAAGFATVTSDDAGDYVCNATLYRSLAVFRGTSRRVGFIHVPPRNVLSADRLLHAARLILAITVTRAQQLKQVSPSAVTPE
jgi:pyroglutamyl-peptidase